MSQPVQAAASGPADAGDSPRRRRRRHIRGPIWLLCTLIFLGIVFVLVDKTATAVAQDKVATKLTGQRPFSGRPTVVIRGFPFLTQAVGGKYREIRVSGPGQPIAGLGAAQIDAQLHGVHIPLSDVAAGVGSVPVDHADVQVRLPVSRLGAAVGVRGLKLTASGSNLRVYAPISLAGLVNVNVTAIAHLGVSGRSITVTVGSVRINGSAAPSAVASAAERALTVKIPVDTLGFSVKAASATVQGGQLVVSGSADNVVLH
jgi:hypothetical protein